MGMKIKNNQTGIAHVAAIVLVIVIAVIGFVGWKVWDNQKDKPQTTNTNTTAASSDTATTDTNKDTHLDISEWGVRITVDPTIAKVTYVYNASQDSVTLTSDLQKSLSSECEYATKSPWGISRLSTETVAASPDVYLGYDEKVGDYSFRRTYPQTGCEDSDNDTMTKLDAGFAAIYKSLETLN